MISNSFLIIAGFISASLIAITIAFFNISQAQSEDNYLEKNYFQKRVFTLDINTYRRYFISVKAMTKKEPKNKRINDILDSAIQEFIEKGYENTSMESIAARSGLTKGGLYYHFNSKDDILVKANEAFMEPVIAFMNEAMNDPVPSEGLAGYIRNYLTYWTNHPRELSFVFLTMTKTMSNEQFQRFYIGYTLQMSGFFDSIYRLGIEKGVFKSFNTRSVAITLMAALDGIIGYLVIDSDLSLEKTIADFTESFITMYKGADA